MTSSKSEGFLTSATRNKRQAFRNAVICTLSTADH